MTGHATHGSVETAGTSTHSTLEYLMGILGTGEDCRYVLTVRGRRSGRAYSVM